MIPESFTVELVPWEEAVSLSRALAEQIRGRFSPGIILAIGRGGFVPARIVADSLMMKNMTCIRVEHWGDAAKCTREAYIRYPLSHSIEGQDVLVIDDVTDTGETLAVTMEYLSSQKCGSVKTGVLHHKKVSAFTPDYYVKEVSGWHWIVYPWALHEDLTAFLDNMLSATPASFGDLHEALREKYGMNAGRDEIAFAARELIASGKAVKTERGIVRANQKVSG